MPNWDDQFDFDDLDDKKKAKPVKKANDKKANNYDDDFFDDQDNSKKKQVKSILPTINQRNSATSKASKQQSFTKVNPYADKVFGNKSGVKQDQQIYEEEQFEDFKDKKSPQKGSAKQVPKSTHQVSSKHLIKNKSEVSEEYGDEYLQEIQEDKPADNKNKNSKPAKDNQAVSKSEEYAPKLSLAKNNQSSNKNIISSSLNNNKSQKEEADEYEEEFENDQYKDDEFEEEVKSPVKKDLGKAKVTDKVSQKNIPKNSLKLSVQQPKKAPAKNNNLTANQNTKAKQVPVRSQSVAPPKPPQKDKKGTKQAIISNKNIHKVESQSVSKPLKRSNSRQSIRSNGQRSLKASRISQKNESQFFPNKHSDIVEKSFPQDQDKLNALSQFQINKINQKMRAMIKKFNDELNDLINKNMLLLKNKSLEKHFSLQEKIRELEIQKKSGQTAIEVMEKDFDKLHGREGQLKQEEYQLILEKQIEEKKTLIKETAKEIMIIKREVDTKGKKLTGKQSEQRNAQNIHHLKTILIQTKKDEQKGDERIQKLNSTFEELETKISDQDYRLDELVSEAKQKGISIENNDHLVKKFQEYKTKLENIKNFNKKTEGLNNTKIDILNHENQQIRIAIRNINSQISNLYGSIDHSQSEAIKIIEKAKQRANIHPLFEENLDRLLKQIQESRSSNDYMDARSEIKSRRSDSAKNKSMKSSTEENAEKSMPLRVTQSQNKLVEQDSGVAKPKFLKKKPAEQPYKLDAQNKSQVNQRVWNEGEDKKAKSPKNDQNKKVIQQVSKVQEVIKKQVIKQEPKTVVVEQEKKDKSKPFMLKKNKPENKQEKSIESAPIQQKPILSEPLKVKEDLKIKQSTTQETPSINIAPRMMRFGRKKENQDVSSQNNIVLPSENKAKQLNLKPKEEQLKIPDPPKVQTQEDKPIFVPKRFNLKSKAEKKDDSYIPSSQKDDSYLPSAKNIETEKAASPVQPVKEEYKPKFDFKNEQLKISSQAPKNVEQKPIVIQEPEIKPRFNLRLRDRNNPKNNEETQTYAPSIGLNKNISEESMMAPKQEIKSNNNNPYVIPEIKSNNPYVVSESKNVQKNQVPVTNQINVPAKIEQPYTPSNNPYAPKVNDGQQGGNLIAKKQRGPLKKGKIQAEIPKQSFNIYAQAEDLTNDVKEFGKSIPNNISNNSNNPNQTNPVAQPQNNKKTQEININQMLGIQKPKNKNDFDDLLGDVSLKAGNNKKKNNDFFSDLQF